MMDDGWWMIDDGWWMIDDRWWHTKTGMNDKYSTFQQCWISSFIPLLGGMNTVFIPLERDEYHIHPSEEGWIWYSSLKIYGQCWTRKYQHSEGIFHPSREGSDQKSCHVEMIIKKKKRRDKIWKKNWILVPGTWKKLWKIRTFSTWDLNSWNRAQFEKKNKHCKKIRY